MVLLTIEQAIQMDACEAGIERAKENFPDGNILYPHPAWEGNQGYLLWLTRNPSTPADSLAILAKDGNGCVRYNVARNPFTPADSLAILAKDEDMDVRLAAVRNLSTPKE